MFIAPLFITSKSYKQSTCPSAGEWVNIFTMEYYSVIKRNCERATDSHNIMDKSYVHFAKRQKP